MDLFLNILPWALALVSSITLYEKQDTYRSLKKEAEDIKSHLAYVEDAQENLKELFEKQEDNYNQINEAKEKLISELQKKLRGMIAPDPSQREPIIIMEDKFKRLSSKLELPLGGGDVNKT